MGGSHYLAPAYGSYHLDMSQSTYNLEIWGDGFSGSGAQEFEIRKVDMPMGPATVAPTGVTVSPATLALVGVGATGLLAATVAPADATDRAVTWSTSNAAIATVGMDGTVTAVSAGTTTITARTSNGKVATCKVIVGAPVADVPIHVSYRTHVQSDGWQGYVRDGETSGTSGRSLRLEGINIKLEGADGGIQYRTHIQSVGWEGGWKSDDQMSGTSGRALRLEAVQIRLTGNVAKTHDVWYRVHAQSFGWLGWARDGESSGTAGYGYRLEGIEVRVLPKGATPPGEH